MTHQEATHRRSERQGVPDPEGGQLALPLDLADHHRRPLCSMGRDPRTGYWTGSYRRPPVEAWADWRHVEHNTETSIVGIFLDVDEPGAVHVAADDSLVPWPSWVMTRLGNGHQAACWLLENPVHTYPGSREKPRQLLRRTAEYFASTCDADPAYAGTLFRNVGLASRESGFVVEGTDRQWPLLELAESIPFGWRVPSRKKLRTAVGRNVSLFELLMREAGREHVADDRIRMLAWGANEAFDWPLGSLEVACTVRSVLRYRAQWREAGWHDPRFRTRQAARGQRGGKANGRRRRLKAEKAAQTALDLRAEGMTQREIAGELGCTTRTVRSYLTNRKRSQHRIGPGIVENSVLNHPREKGLEKVESERRSRSSGDARRQ